MSKYITWITNRSGLLPEHEKLSQNYVCPEGLSGELTSIEGIRPEKLADV